MRRDACEPLEQSEARRDPQLVVVRHRVPLDPGLDRRVLCVLAFVGFRQRPAAGEGGQRSGEGFDSVAGSTVGLDAEQGTLEDGACNRWVVFEGLGPSRGVPSGVQKKERRSQSGPPVVSFKTMRALAFMRQKQASLTHRQ